MSFAFESLERLSKALHAPDAPPSGPGWNLVDLIDALPGGVDALRPAAVLIALTERAGDLQVLLTRRTEALRHHAGQISFPGGRIESSDANPLAAALREADEEVGLPPDLVTPLGFLDPFVTITGFHVFPLVALIDAAFVPRIDPNEVAEAFEVPLSFLLDANNVKHSEIEFQGRARRLSEFHHSGHRIWGATAAMLVNFRQRLEAHL